MPEGILGKLSSYNYAGETTRELAGEKTPVSSKVSQFMFPDKFREKAVNSIYPYGYGEGARSGKGILNQARAFVNAWKSPGSEETSQRLDLNNKAHRNRYDAFRMYSDLPQKYGTFTKSEYRPTQSKEAKNEKTVYYRFSDKAAEKRYLEAAVTYGLLDKGVGSNINIPDIYSGGKGNSVMNIGTLGYGKDEKGHYISYADKWDLAGKDKIPGVRNVFGRPFNIYGRIYLSEQELAALKKKKFRAEPNLTRSDYKEGNVGPQIEDTKKMIAPYLQQGAENTRSILDNMGKYLR